MWPQTGEESSPDTPNTLEQITNYNNYYEFSTDKEDVARLSKGFKTEPWSVAVGGLVAKPRSFTVPELVGMFPPRSGSTACAASKAGRWSSPGWASP